MGMEFEINCCHDNAFHESGIRGQVSGVLRLDTVTQVYSVFGHGLFVRIIQPEVPVAFLDPGLNVTPGLTNVDLTTFAGDLVDASCFQVEVSLDGPKENGDLQRRGPTNFILCLVSTVQMRLKIGPIKCVDSSPGLSPFQGSQGARCICLSLWPFCSNIIRRNSNTPGRISW
jgi:hypothetical protein